MCGPTLVHFSYLDCYSSMDLLAVQIMPQSFFIILNKRQQPRVKFENLQMKKRLTFGSFSCLKYLFFVSFRLPVCSLRRAIAPYSPSKDCRLAVESSQKINISIKRTSQRSLCTVLVSPPTFLKTRLAKSFHFHTKCSVDQS